MHNASLHTSVLIQTEHTEHGGINWLIGWLDFDLLSHTKDLRQLANKNQEMQ